ncbi:MAG: alpha/beta fold hydrolase [Actinobacteria bacterium]|nr:alpha/beta fold hydrolase [Actinomycetota bacterium]
MEPADAKGAPPPLHQVHAGESGPRVVLVHGFTQTHVAWMPVVAELVRDHQVVAVDLPGHGGSSEIAADLPLAARLLGEAGGHATYVGYSLGGRVALRLALDHPDLVDGLVLLGATAGIDDPAERAARRDADGALADRIVDDGLPRFLREWFAQPLFDGLRPDPADRAARLANSPAGLASSLRLAGTGTMDPPWWDELGSIEAPLLACAGARDAKFAALAERLAAGSAGPARVVLLDGCGHAAHLQDPAAFAAEVRTFVTALPR